MSADLVLRSSCGGCGSTSDLYGTSCKHMTVCFSCGKSMTEKRAKCFECGAIVTRLIREYNIIIRPSSTGNDKDYFIGRFVNGLPSFPMKKNIKWRLHKDGQVSHTLREKYKNKPWVLEDENGDSRYQGNLEGAPTANYHILIKQGNEFLAVPAGSWFNFNKVAQYKQLTLEEAEEKIKNKKRTADGYQRWMMKAANNGAALFGQVAERLDKDNVAAGGTGRGRKQTLIGGDDDDEGNVSDDEEDQLARKKRLKKLRDGDDSDVEKGDDWEHEDIFSDDDEAVGNHEEWKDLEPEVRAPPELVHDDEDDEEKDEDEKEGGLSKSGKGLKKLLGKTFWVNKEEDEDDNVDDDTAGIPKVLPSDLVPNSDSGSSQSPGTTLSTSYSASKGKRKSNGNDVMALASKSSSPNSLKKVKTESKQKPSYSAGSSSNKTSVPPNTTPSVKMETSSITGEPIITEEEIRAAILQKTPITTLDLVALFKKRVRLPEEKKAFSDILKRICTIHTGSGNQKPTLMLLDQKVARSS